MWLLVCRKVHGPPVPEEMLSDSDVDIGKASGARCSAGQLSDSGSEGTAIPSASQTLQQLPAASSQSASSSAQWELSDSGMESDSFMGEGEATDHESDNGADVPKQDLTDSMSSY